MKWLNISLLRLELRALHFSRLYSRFLRDL